MHKTYLLYLYAVVLTLIIGCTCMLAVNIWPFGTECFTLLDNAQQTAPALASLRLILSGTEDWNWTFLSGGVNRTAFLAGYHLFFIPSVWLACLLPAESCLQTQSWLFLIQIACCSASALFYLNKSFRGCPTTVRIALAVSYTFSGFLFTKFSYLPFLNIPALFPLFLYALDALLKRGKYWLYLLISTYMLAVAPYFFWMWGIFSVIYIGARLKLGWSLYKNRRTQLHLLLFAGISLSALGLSAFSWVPSYSLTAESARTEMIGSLSIFFTTYEGPAFLTCWMLTPLLFGAMALSTRLFRLLFKSPYGLTLILLLVCCCCVTMNWFMHMGPPSSFPVRFSYMLTMMSCCVTAQGMETEARETFGEPNAKAVLTALLSVALLIYAAQIALVLQGLWLLAFATTIILWHKRYFKTFLLVLACVLGGAFVKSFRVEERQLSQRFNLAILPERVIRAEQLQRDLSSHQRAPWSRVRSVDLCLSSNFSEVSGLNSFCNYLHSSTASQQETVNRLGYLKFFTRICDTGGTIFSDAFMGCEFLVSHYPLCAPLPERLPGMDSLYVYRNPYYWGDGVLLSQNACDQAGEWGDDPISNQQILFEELGGEGQLFDRRKATLEWENEEYMYAVYRTEGNEWLYAHSLSFPVESNYFQKTWHDERYAAGSIGQPTDGILVSLPSSAAAAPMRVLQLRTAPSEDGACRGELSDTEVDLYRLNTEKLTQLAQKHRDKVRITAIRGRIMEVEVHPDEGDTVLLLPYVYHEGYSARDEAGHPLRLFEHHGFTAISLPKAGRQKVLLHYTLPHEYGALAVSLASLLLLPLPALLRCRSKKRSEGKWARAGELLLSIAAVLGSWFVLSCPLWTMLVRIIFDLA